MVQMEEALARLYIKKYNVKLYFKSEQNLQWQKLQLQRAKTLDIKL